MRVEDNSSLQGKRLHNDNSDRMRIKIEDYKSAEMQILMHHVYEYKKGLRNLVLHTMNRREKHITEEMLTRKGISFYMQQLPSGKINVFFGNDKCVKIIESFGHKTLNDFTDEEDFILEPCWVMTECNSASDFLKRRTTKAQVLANTGS